MIKLLLLASCIFVLLVSAGAFAQDRAGLVSGSGDLSGIRGKTKFFLIADEQYKTIMGLLKKKDTGLQPAATSEEADFIVEFTADKIDAAPKGSSAAPRSVYGLDGRLAVYYMDGDKRVPVWDKTGKGITVDEFPGATGDSGLRLLATMLTKKFLKDLKN